MFGYGGFGYDASHVPRDDPTPPIVVEAGKGNLTKVKFLVEGTPEKPLDATQKRCILNVSKRWTEVDYKASGFTKEWEWHGATPLIAAARNGHADVVEYLLRNGADPTLQGCVRDDVHWDAFSAADKSIRLEDGTKAEKWMVSYPDIVNDESLSSEQAAKRLHQVGNNGKRHCIRLLNSAKPFWNPASYSSSHYSKSRESCKFSNKPKNMTHLIEALDAVDPMPEATEAALTDLVAKVEAQRTEHQKKAVAAGNHRQGGRKRNLSKRGQSGIAVCRFFLQGRCRYGDDCRFSHEHK